MEKFVHKENLKPESKEMYNRFYSGKEFFFGLEPSELVLMSVESLKPNSNILDLGCGEGRNAFYLAKGGFNVTAVDESDAGIVKLENFAWQNNLDIRTATSDIESFLDSCDNFDSIYCLNVLQFVDESRVLSVIEKMKNKTNPDGFNIVASFIAENEEQRRKVLSGGGYFFNEGELRELYSDWAISFYEEELGERETHGGKVPEHRHYKVRMIAQKP